MKNRERWMMKFWLAFILCCISLVLVPMQSESAVYKDVEGSYAASAIEFLAAKGIMQGVTAERFAPEQAITRGDFITVLAKTMGIMPVYPHEATFLDVKKEDSAFGYVEAFGQLGLIKGDNQGFFHSNDPISRQDAAVILSQLGQSNDTGSPVTYKDAGEIAAYAQEAVAQVTQKGWLQGSEGAFKPLDLLTRAQSAVIAQQVYRWRTSQANILSPVEAQVTLEAGETLPGFSASSPLDYTCLLYTSCGYFKASKISSHYQIGILTRCMAGD